MSDPCQQEANIAVIKQRLMSGDTILEKLEKQMDGLVLSVSELLHCVKSDDGILAKQKTHGDVINRIVNKDIVEKVERHEQRYIVQSWAIGFFGFVSMASIIGLILAVNRLMVLLK